MHLGKLNCTDRSRVFIRSGAPCSIYTKQGTLIRSRKFGVGHRAIRIGHSEQDTQLYGVGHSEQDTQLYGVGHWEQDIRLYGEGHSEQDNCLYAVRHSGQGQRMVYRYSACHYSKGHHRQLCLISDNGELKHVC